jgi:hypothetical protein
MFLNCPFSGALSAKNEVGHRTALQVSGALIKASTSLELSAPEKIALFRSLFRGRECDVPAVLERSRSRTGAHVRVFFGAPVSAGLPRKSGACLLTRTMERRDQVGLRSYDRVFPTQDTMPNGGFGNPIVLPLQRFCAELATASL